MGTLVRCSDTGRWPSGLWPHKREKGEHATAVGGVSLPLLGQDPLSLGAAAGMASILVQPRPWPRCSLVEERAWQVLTPLIVFMCLIKKNH